MATSTPEYGFPVPQSTDPPRGYEQIEDLALAIETVLNMPDSAEAHIAATVSPTSSSFATLPSPGPLSLNFTNPSSVYKLEVDLYFSAWVAGATSTTVQVGVAASGGLTWTANGFGGAGPQSNADNLFAGAALPASQQSVTYPVIIPAGAAAVTFTMQALRSGANAVFCNYPIIRVKPRRFVAP